MTIDARLVSASFRDRREIVAKDGREGANWDKNFFERYIYIYIDIFCLRFLFSLCHFRFSSRSKSCLRLEGQIRMRILKSIHFTKFLERFIDIFVHDLRSKESDV